MPPRPIPVTTSIAKSDVQSSHMNRDLEEDTQQLKITTVVSSREHISLSIMWFAWHNEEKNDEEFDLSPANQKYFKSEE